MLSQGGDNQDGRLWSWDDRLWRWAWGMSGKLVGNGDASEWTLGNSSGLGVGWEFIGGAKRERKIYANGFVFCLQRVATISVQG